MSTDPRIQKLAEARQRIAHEGISYLPAWDDLTEEQREQSVREASNWLRAAVEAGIATQPATFADGGVNDIRQLYTLQGAITDAGGELTRAVHRAIDDLRTVWDRELRREQRRRKAAEFPEAPATSAP